ncbi:MAG: hypothetical protein DHS20C05_10540 [Hyphococcus sp.]|nr:MAG: hypothetical protein DHS20C05_10540 [Marinicaulis sp.]
MTSASVEEHIKEKSFGKIDTAFHDFQVVYNLNDVSVIGWPEKYVLSEETHSNEALSNVLADSRQIIRDLSRSLEIAFTDVYLMQLHEEGWENWKLPHATIPKLDTDKRSRLTFPILKVCNSRWIYEGMPEWNHDWIAEVSHWRLISLTNTIDICARSVKGAWVDHPA